MSVKLLLGLWFVFCVFLFVVCRKPAMREFDRRFDALLRLVRR